MSLAFLESEFGNWGIWSAVLAGRGQGTIVVPGADFQCEVHQPLKVSM